MAGEAGEGDGDWGHAAGLSDVELWVDLERVYDEWLEANRGRKRFEQPRLAIMLAREVGKRDGEAGMKAVAKWLEERDRKVMASGDDSLEKERQFGDLRVRVAGFAGWVSVDPEKAISRIIESRLMEEDDWPVVNQGYFQYFKLPEFFAVEEVLRDGFRQMAQTDFERAKELFGEGLGVWAFDANEVVGSLLAEIPRKEWPEFLADLREEVGEKVEENDEDVVVSLVFLFRDEIWTTGYWEQEEKSGGGRNDALWAFTRDRPDEAILALKDDRISEEKKRWLYLGMVMSDSKHYGLLDQLEDSQKERAVEVLVTAARGYEFGLLVGKDGSGEFDGKKLMKAIKEASMSEETRERLKGLVAE